MFWFLSQIFTFVQLVRSSRRRLGCRCRHALFVFKRILSLLLFVCLFVCLFVKREMFVCFDWLLFEIRRRENEQANCDCANVWCLRLVAHFLLLNSWVESTRNRKQAETEVEINKKPTKRKKKKANLNGNKSLLYFLVLNSIRQTTPNETSERTNERQQPQSRTILISCEVSSFRLS